MESPVMTSASSHRLRSAVSACAQPTHSYLNSSYLTSSIQVESHNSGGCLKKFYSSGKNGESSLLNITKKSHSSTDCSPLYKRYKSCARNGFGHHCRAKSNGREQEASTDRGVLNLIPKQFMTGNHFLSRLSLRRHFLDSARLSDYPDSPTRNQSVTDSCEKVINGKSAHKNSKKSTSDAIRNINKPLNHRQDACNRLKIKNRATTVNRDAVNEQNQLTDECSTYAHDHQDFSDTIDHISKCHPNNSVTGRTTHILREIRNVRQSGVGTSKSVPSKCICSLFEDSQLFPVAPEVREMLQCAKECPGNPTPAAFPEFCRIQHINKSNAVCEVKRASPPQRAPDRNEEKRSRKVSRGMSKYEVFLGGSCNPTTWRTDFAIPELERMGISYFNPQQVEEWRPELMEVEYHAKENATVMFFVLDNQTRGVSALIEVSHLAGNRRKLILVVQSYTQKNQIICDEKISKEEYLDLRTGQEVLQDLVQRQGIPVFDDIQVALNCTEKILKENLTVQDLQALVRVNSESPKGSRDVSEKPDAESSGEMSAAVPCRALKALTGLEVSVSELRNFVTKPEGGALSKRPSLPALCCRDVYLGGTIENTSWRESIAVPILEEQNLSFFVPVVSEGRNRFTETEAAAMEHSFILLFAITNTARSIAAMAIAGHYIGRGANVVLCVEHLPANATIGEEKLSENAVKDYNRGRMYLMDIAKRSGVPVFTDISMAVKFVTQKCRNR